MQADRNDDSHGVRHAGGFVQFWPDGPLFWWHRDGTIQPVAGGTVDLSAWEAECTRLRYGEGLAPPAIAQQTGRPCSAVNSALNRVRAKADAQWLTYRQVRQRFTGRSVPA